MKPTLLFIFSLITVYTLNGQSVLINEFMSKNNTTIQDKDGDYSDWIEIYNSGNEVVNLAGYGLSDNASNYLKWVFPEVNIMPQEYLLIFASGKDYIDITELHTNFKISASGDPLYLSNPSGQLLDIIAPISLSADESYCRIPDGDLNWIITGVTSPNSTNNYSNQLVFSYPQGFYNNEFSLSINSLSGDDVYYTINGDIPTEESQVLMESIQILNQTNEPNILSEIINTPEQDLISYKAWESPQENIDKATILRCVSYRDGVRTSKVYTKTYFVDDNMTNKYTFPVISLITPVENLENYDTGIIVPGLYFNIDNPEWTGNYFRKAAIWEKDVHIEYFDNNGNLEFSQNAGLRINGGKTRHATQKSLRLYAREEYGEKYFNYPLLPHRPVNKYKRFILRASMGSWGGQAIIKDVVAQKIASSLNVDYQEFQPVIVYLNGEYWGIHTLRDRIDERYIEYTHGIDKDSVEFYSKTNTHYSNMLEYMENNNMENPEHYNYIKTQMDIDAFIDYTIAEFFFKNYDWPGNNIEAWRKLPDGKWRWVFFDLDAGFGNPDFNMFVHATGTDTTITWPNPAFSTVKFRNLFKNESFVNQLIERYADVLNNHFIVEDMINEMNSVKELYSPEIQKHIDRWNYPDSYSSWEADIDNGLKVFLEERSCYVRDNIISFFNLPDFDFHCNTSVNEISGIDQLIIYPNPSNGHFILTNNKSEITNAQVYITNINGQIVYKQHNITLLNGEQKSFDLSALPNNIYLFQLKSNDYSVQKKIVLSK